VLIIQKSKTINGHKTITLQKRRLLFVVGTDGWGVQRGIDKKKSQ